ncbi:hypothetical protein SAMN05660748_4503 [Blastococcus aggregatus]|uniref:Uncharacterized protein n=1 Tax=Blastococcus aggregatus TaxID=38502 RepID=A0A285VHQ5_9ACTN|nr:hypothetical protein [Blastococcus aggregatus]SOC53580.1 hypothetical protein SAMN05660748_4503 [Blastococcus aggregatus]
MSSACPSPRETEGTLAATTFSFQSTPAALQAFDVMLGRLVALALADQWPALMRDVVVGELRALASGEGTVA